MHLGILTRGDIRSMNTFIDELSSRYLPIAYKGEKKRSVRLRVSPIQLWDICFPKESWDAVATTILGKDRDVAGKPMIKGHQKYLWALRKAMRLKKIPDWKTDNWLTMQDPANIEIMGIGVKDDYWITEDGRHVAEKDKTPLSYEGL